MRSRRILSPLTEFGLIAFAGAWAPIAAPAQAQQFTADIITSNAAEEVLGVPAHIYAANGKVRIETPELPDHYFVVDGAIPAAFAVHPGSHVYMDAKQSSRLTRIFVPLDPVDPCRQWEIMAEVAGIPEQSGRWHCDVDGAEEVEGRSTVRYTMTSPRGRSRSWIDPRLRFPVRFETEDFAVFALRNIQQGPQPAEKFEIPGNYRKFDVKRLLELLKHTDLYVAPPQLEETSRK